VLILNCRFHHQWVPLVILVCRTACTGKPTIAKQLAQRFNLPDVLQVYFPSPFPWLCIVLHLIFFLLKTARETPVVLRLLTWLTWRPYHRILQRRQSCLQMYVIFHHFAQNKASSRWLDGFCSKKKRFWYWMTNQLSIKVQGVWFRLICMHMIDRPGVFYSLSRCWMLLILMFKFCSRLLCC
jgi:hypothetical protein